MLDLLMPVHITFDLGPRVKTAFSTYLAVHEQIFDQGIARSSSFTGRDYESHIRVLSAVRTSLDEATRSAEDLSKDPPDTPERAYLAALHAYAMAVDEAVAKLLTLCRVCAEREPRPPEVARYRVAVERYVARELALEEAESRLPGERRRPAPGMPSTSAPRTSS